MLLIPKFFLYLKQTLMFFISLWSTCWSLSSIIYFVLSCSGGFFIAVKEVSLLDQGDQGRQSIHQLEQVRWLLSFVGCSYYASLISVLHFFFIIDFWEGSSRHLCFVFLCFVQEIALLSQFEHENIVQYYGTAKVHFFAFHPFLWLMLSQVFLVHLCGFVEVGSNWSETVTGQIRQVFMAALMTQISGPLIK